MTVNYTVEAILELESPNRLNYIIYQSQDWEWDKFSQVWRRGYEAKSDSEMPDYSGDSGAAMGLMEGAACDWELSREAGWYRLVLRGPVCISACIREVSAALAMCKAWIVLQIEKESRDANES